MKIYGNIPSATLVLLVGSSIMSGQSVGTRPAVAVPVAHITAGTATRTATTVSVQSPLRVQVEPPPAVAPQVTCNAGLVTVRAENSTLASVLHAIGRCAGTIVHMPAEIGATRVMARYGPAQPMALFAALLDGSADYVILGSRRSLSSVQMVIVKPHQALSSAGQPGAQAALKQASVPQTFIDEEGVERLPSGLTPEEANVTPEELAQKFEAARQEQKRLDQLARPGSPQQP